MIDTTNHCPLCESYAKRVKELQKIVDRLPKTADGVPFSQGDSFWSYDEEGIFECTTDPEDDWKDTEVFGHVVDHEESGSYTTADVPMANIYSTREAAEKAAKEKKS